MQKGKAVLKLKYLYENYELARLALSNWRHDGEGLDELLARFRISNNAVYPFRRDGRMCFLRLTPAGERLERNVLGELGFVEYLGERGYPALRYIPAVTGEKVLKLSTPWGGYYAAAFEDVGGVPLEETRLSANVLQAYGRALGRLHSLSEEYRPKVRKWSHSDLLDWTGRVLRQYHAPREILAAAEAMRGELAELSQETGSYGLIHYDFEYDNVFYDRDGDICRVIDFDDGMYHWFAMDVEQALMSLEDGQDELGLAGKRLREAEAAFLSGYREQHPYTREMEASRPIMRRFGTLHSYAKLIRSVAEKQEDEPEWMLQLRAKLDAAIKRKAGEITKNMT